MIVYNITHQTAANETRDLTTLNDTELLDIGCSRTWINTGLVSRILVARLYMDRTGTRYLPMVQIRFSSGDFVQVLGTVDEWATKIAQTSRPNNISRRIG